MTRLLISLSPWLLKAVLEAVFPQEAKACACYLKDSTFGCITAPTVKLFIDKTC